MTAVLDKIAKAFQPDPGDHENDRLDRSRRQGRLMVAVYSRLRGSMCAARQVNYNMLK